MSKVDVEFFRKHAGYSYDPTTETAEQGRQRCAENLAAAEGIARNAGVSFEWIIDPEERGGTRRNPYPLYGCIAHDHLGGHATSLWAIDFGRDGSPYSDDYRRVVEAELALELFNNMLTQEEQQT